MDRRTAEFRSRLFHHTRDFFIQNGYLEVDTPLLAPALIPESSIEVFKTFFQHPDQGNHPLYLIPSPEVWMKRLISGGWGSLFQICKAFRNAESIGRNHNPEFTLLEYYTLGADYLSSIEVTEEYFRYILSHIDPEDIYPEVETLSPPFQRATMQEVFQEFVGFDLSVCSREDLIEQARSLGMVVPENETWEAVFNRIFVDRVEPRLPRNRPLVLLDYPAEVLCLAKRIPGTPWRERWELYIGGLETANCFSEETNPQEVEEYFRIEEECKTRAAIPHPSAEEFRRMYQTGFPPCSGVALGMDRLLMKLLGKASIEGVIFFPLSDILNPKFLT
ncbi:MAG: hypothetical protein KA771_09470 [Spirochaetales bacterium]|nr:hypothetical protein [Spirochaetales bacterium]